MMASIRLQFRVGFGWIWRRFCYDSDDYGREDHLRVSPLDDSIELRNAGGEEYPAHGTL